MSLPAPARQPAVVFRNESNDESLHAGIRTETAEGQTTLEGRRLGAGAAAGEAASPGVRPARQSGF